MRLLRMIHADPLSKILAAALFIVSCSIQINPVLALSAVSPRPSSSIRTGDSSVDGIFTPSLPLDIQGHTNFFDYHHHQEAHDSPYLALITNRNACDSLEHFEQACWALTEALETTKVDLVSVRITKPSSESSSLAKTEKSALVQRLIQVLVDLKACPVVVHQDWLAEAVAAQAHGVHVKEFQWDDRALEEIQTSFAEAGLPRPMIGTTCHSLESALQAMTGEESQRKQEQSRRQMRLDYLFVGSCYFSGDSHPEKTKLEGPALPGNVAKALLSLTSAGSPNHLPDVHKAKDFFGNTSHDSQARIWKQEEYGGLYQRRIPPVFAIGGLDVSNVHEPVQLGADGVTVIRSILQSEDPAQSARSIWGQMQIPPSPPSSSPREYDGDSVTN